MTSRVTTGEPHEQGPGDDPLYHYTRVFVRFFQLVFGSFERGHYRWSLDENNSEIIISDQSTLSREAVEKRPAIVIARGPVAYGNIAMDQLAGPHTTKDGTFVPNHDPKTGARRYTDLVSASVSINCISKEGIEAQRIAHCCAMSVRRLKRTLMRAGMHRVGEEVQIGAESSPGALVAGDSDTEAIMVSVSVPFYFQDFWTVEPVDKLLLKNIDLALTSGGDKAASLREPTIYGRPLTGSWISLNSWTRVDEGPTPKPRK